MMGGVKPLPFLFVALVCGLLPAPAPAQQCLGLPVEAGGHAAGALVETETGYTLLAAHYAGASRAFAWRAHAGGVMRDFPGEFPDDFGPAVGAGVAWLGASRATCPTLGLETFDEDPVAVPELPGDPDLDVTTLTLGWGFGFSTFPDTSRVARAIVYAVPQVRWVRTARAFGDVEDVDVDRQLGFEAGITGTWRRLWGGGGARVRFREDNDYPLDAVLLVRGGVRW